MPDFESFDSDEVFLLIASAVICFVGLMHWVRSLRPVSKLGCPPFYRAPIYLAGLAGFLVLALVVQRWADPQIRANSGYVLLVFVMGGACLVLSLGVLPWLGLGLRDDAFERRNRAAVVALGGAVFAVLVTYAAANTGTGPSFWNNVFSTLLATGSLLVLWAVVAASGGAAASLTEERDLASGWRSAGFFVAEGLVLGRAVAGDWESAGGTVVDFCRYGWPALVICLVAAGVETLVRPSRNNPNPSTFGAGLVPSLVYVTLSGAWVMHLGWWKGGGL